MVNTVKAQQEVTGDWKSQHVYFDELSSAQLWSACAELQLLGCRLFPEVRFLTLLRNCLLQKHHGWSSCAGSPATGGDATQAQASAIDGTSRVVQRLRKDSDAWRHRCIIDQHAS
jgi:hypothetical protein